MNWSDWLAEGLRETVQTWRFNLETLWRGRGESGGSGRGGMAALAERLLWETAELVEEGRRAVNAACLGLEPWQIIAYTLGAVSVLLYANYFLQAPEPLAQRLKRLFFRTVRRLPIVSSKIAKEIDTARASIHHAIHAPDKQRRFHRYLPDQGLSKTELLALTDEYTGMGIDYTKGTISGAVYGGRPEVTEVLTQVFAKTAWSNPLHPDVFPGVRKMEAEIVRMTLNLYHGGPSATGCVTSGGTESILLACLAYRNRALAKGIAEPEILAPVTAHAAFDKASDYFQIRLRKVPVDPKTQKVDIKAMRKAINGSTAALVGSAPQFPHGTMDPLEEIAALGLAKDIPVHVDACLGGFLIPFMELAGSPAPHMFDFRLGGVTSISADTHKYGYTSKGTSVLMYRRAEDLHHQYFSQPDWPGGIYASPSIAGSRCGAAIACCWAALLLHGKDGYVAATRAVLATTRRLAAEIPNIPGLRVVGIPEVSVVAFTAEGFSIYVLADRISKKGWSLNALQFPASIHIAVTPLHCQEGVIDRLLGDLRSVSAELASSPPNPKDAKGTNVIYGTTQAIPDRSLVAEMTHLFLDACITTHPIDQEPNGHAN